MSSLRKRPCSELHFIVDSHRSLQKTNFRITESYWFDHNVERSLCDDPTQLAWPTSDQWLRGLVYVLSSPRWVGRVPRSQNKLPKLSRRAVMSRASRARVFLCRVALFIKHVWKFEDARLGNRAVSVCLRCFRSTWWVTGGDHDAVVWVTDELHCISLNIFAFDLWSGWCSFYKFVSVYDKKPRYFC